jgi:predicted RNA-binding protein Jag
MVVKEFEGKNEKEAIDRAIEELGLDRTEIDFEIVESKRPGILFRGGKVKIRVHIAEEHIAVAPTDEDVAMERRVRREHGGEPFRDLTAGAREPAGPDREAAPRPPAQNLPPDG